jgi:hypothetical protein
MGLKASDHILYSLWLFEEYGVTFKKLPGKKHVTVDALSHLAIDQLKFKKKKLYCFSLNHKYYPDMQT